MQVAILLGLLFCLPVWPFIKKTCFIKSSVCVMAYDVLKPIAILVLLLLSSMLLVSGTHNPFIYFRF